MMTRFIKIMDSEKVIHHINLNAIIEIRQYSNDKVIIVTAKDSWVVNMTIDDVQNIINQ